MQIAVLLAAYNGEKFIQKQIESILAQENVHVTIFISIDHSVDETRALLEETYLAYPNIVILKDIGRIGSAAKNFFRLIREVDLSYFDYVALADQDDIWYTDKLMRATYKLQETGSDGYSSNVVAFWDDGKEKLIVKSQPQCQYDFLFEAAGPGCTYVLTKHLVLSLQKNVLENETVLEGIWFHDWFVYAYARAHGFHWIIDERPSMHYRQHANNVIGANHGLSAFLYRCKKVLFGGALLQARLIATIIGMDQNAFVQQWHMLERLSYLRLALHFYECRRRLKDKVFFFFACLFMSIIHPKIEPIEVYK